MLTHRVYYRCFVVSYNPIPNSQGHILIAFSMSTPQCATSENSLAKMRSSCSLKSLSINCATKAKIDFLAKFGTQHHRKSIKFNNLIAIRNSNIINTSKSRSILGSDMNRRSNGNIGGDRNSSNNNRSISSNINISYQKASITICTFYRLHPKCR